MRVARSGFGSGPENLGKALGDELFFAGFELPDGEAEGVRVARRAMLGGLEVVGGRFGIAAAKAAGVRSHAADGDGARLRELLHDFLGGNVELGRIDLPGVMRRDVP